MMFVLQCHKFKGKTMKISRWLYRLNKPLKIWFEPRDIWIGVYWKQEKFSDEKIIITNIYICIFPMLPLLISVVMWKISDK